jgi:hypothetical protein
MVGLLIWQWSKMIPEAEGEFASALMLMHDIVGRKEDGSLF